MNKLCFLVGILCFTIPVFLQIKDKSQQESVISTYEQYISECEDEELLECFEKAQKYNEQLYALKESAVGNSVALDYESQLNVTQTGMMGHLQIPEIDVKLPVYHGTSDEILATSIGHLEGTSLPVGGESSHAVLTGHCGLPSAELFTRLDELELEDKFFVQVCNEVMAYQVIEIQVVEPTQVEAISIEPEKDLVSLITCTPYGINTHRLIVTGERIEIEDSVEQVLLTEETKGGVDAKIYYLVGACFVLCIWGVSRSIRGKRRYRNS